MGKNNNSKTNPCEKYELAITNYVLGEKIDIPQQELFNHLAQCPSCQGDLRNWRATYATMRAKEYDAKPEVKQRTKAFIHELVTSKPIPAEARLPKSQRDVGQVKPLPDEVILDPEENIGYFAGVVWHHLARNGRVKEGELRRKVKLPVKTFDRAIGWLAGEKKIHQTRVKQTAYVYLNETEREIYQQQEARG